MEAFQRAWKSATDDDPTGTDKPATLKVADRICEAVYGRKVSEENQATAGAAVHYATGAVLGAAYGAVAQNSAEITTGHGTAFGAAISLVLDEIVVPAAGLHGKPTAEPLSSHVFGLASHLVFGLCLETVRRTLAGRK